jgi:hypothetical protein
MKMSVCRHGGRTAQPTEFLVAPFPWRSNGKGGKLPPGGVEAFGTRAIPLASH